MSTPKPLHLLSVAVVPLLTSSACTETLDQPEYLRAGQFDDAYDGLIDEEVNETDNYLIVTHADMRMCPAPTCGGYFVKWVGEELTPCADGSWQPECHAYDLDFSGIGNDHIDDFVAGRTLVRGTLAEVPNKFGTYNTLIAMETLPETLVEIGAGGGSLEVAEGPLTGLTIDVPPGAVDQDTQFRVQARDILELGEHDTAVGLAAELEPHGVEFLEPVTVTMPLTAELESDDPVLMVKRSNDGRRAIALPENPDQQLDGQISVRVGQFSVFQPFQRKIDEMVAEAEARATCDDLADLGTLADPWSDHMYYYEGMSLSANFLGFEEHGGVDAVYDIDNSQLGSFWYVGLGLYTGVLGGAGTYYAGWASGERDSVHDAWSGNVVGASADTDIASALTGFLGLGVGVAAFISCADLSHLPGIPDNRFCYPEEVQTPWVDAVVGAAGTVSMGLNVFPEFGFGIGNIGVTNSWATSWRSYNLLEAGLLSFAGVPYEFVEFPVEWPATGDTASYIQIESPDGTELGRGREMARAILLTAATPDVRVHAAELAILQGLARDEGQSLAEYCVPQERCVSGQLHYWSSNDCISGAASGTAKLYRFVDNGPNVPDRVYVRDTEIAEDGSFCVEMDTDEDYVIIQRDLEGSGCGPNYFVECRYDIESGVGDEGGACMLDTCEELGQVEFDCGS